MSTITQTTTTLDAAVANGVRKGYAVESRSETQVVMVKGHPTNHILHLILSIVTAGLWLPVWALVSLTGGEKRWVVSA
jgi:Na+-transporting NADH:ubiquinone oxidoreductase subunit NqrC